MAATAAREGAKLPVNVDHVATLRQARKTHYPDAEISGYLIGRKPNKMTVKYEGMKILPWTEVLARSRARFQNGASSTSAFVRARPRWGCVCCGHWCAPFYA